MLRSRWLVLLIGVTAAAALGTASAPPSPAAVVASSDSPPPEDPFPIRRIRVTEEQLPDAIKQLDSGSLVRLPRSEFEARVRAAGAATATVKNAPRLAEATYTATLAGDDLIGDARWEILN